MKQWDHRNVHTLAISLLVSPPGVHEWSLRVCRFAYFVMLGEVETMAVAGVVSCEAW